ncbi:baseplate assembly protein [Sphingobium cupriresistens]|uniref:Baseplate assembly protein n=1 Tax=Sphingobium cupriresistens LL01 TaxID=1420583 RepID=A0A0J7Y4K5_9SPHN|nr:baseplate J/gp47 family protein [Sphingobium cupriresistens]KMS58577.1 baseplate assembly protein [Sphingobium cupriresistens LL01]
MADTTFTAVDLSRLPAPDVVEALDFDTILADAIAKMKAEMPTFQERESDPATKVLRVVSYMVQLIRQRINEAARAVMVAYANGADLDNLGALFGVTRFTVTPADDGLGIAAVMESDTDFRRRMVLAPEGYSVAGPEGAYIFHALSADADVLDASATTPKPDSIRQLVQSVLISHGASAELRNAMAAALNAAVWPGQVILSVLSRTGDGVAPPDLVEKVETYLSDETRRPLTDDVTAQSATVVPYAVVANVTTFRGPDASLVLATARARLDAYVADSHRLGRDITRSAILAALHVEGVQNVALTSPATDIIITRQQAPWCIDIMVTHTGDGE